MGSDDLPANTNFCFPFRISEDADYTAIGFVDSVLDIVSGGRYSKDRERERETEEKKTVTTTTATTTAADEKEVPMEVVVVAEVGDNAEATSEVAAADQKKEDGEIELLKPAKEEEEEVVEESDQAEQIQQALDEAKTLINELQAAQHRRLASAPEPVPPDERETELAEAVTSKLVAIIATSARPMDVVSVEALRRSMGVLVQEQDQVEEQEEVVDLEREPQSQQHQQQQSQPSI